MSKSRNIAVMGGRGTRGCNHGNFTSAGNCTQMHTKTYILRIGEKMTKVLLKNCFLIKT